MKNELYQHKKSDMVKWIITFIVGLLLIAAVVALFIKLDRQTTTTKRTVSALSTRTETIKKAIPLFISVKQSRQTV